MRKSKQNGTDRELTETASGDQPLLAGTEKPESEVTTEKMDPESSTLRYKLTEIPPIPVCIVIALQHVLVSLASALTMSSVVSDSLCAAPGHFIRSRLFGTTIFMQGICTIFQTLVGVRLPVFQGPSSSFMVPLIALSQMPGWSCDEQPTASFHHGNSTDMALHLGTGAVAGTLMANVTEGAHIHSLTLQEKLQQLSGSLMVASLLEVAVGGLGLIRPLLRYIGPLTVAPTIALIGLSLFKLPAMYAKSNPLITLGSAALVVVFALYLSRVKIPIPGCRKGGERTYLPIFQLLPVLLAMLVMWMLCYVLTITGVFPDDKDHPFYYSRTDAKLSIIKLSPWVQIAYPGQFGPPSMNMAAAIGFVAAVLASLVESIGDYYAAARCCNVMPPPDHAMSRGILVEGLGSVMSGAVGAAHATTSYSGNIAMLNLTKTASRSVLVVAGVMLIALSLVGKIGAAIATMPAPILGGIMLVVLGLLATLGMSNLKYADMTSNRNLLVTGIAFLTGLSVPAFVEKNGDMLATGNENVDQVIRVVLGTPMFLGGLVALILDNTAPGTDLERGIVGWRMSHSSAGAKKRQATSTATAATLQRKPARDKESENSSPTTSKSKRAEVQTKEAQRELTEDEIYAFAPLKCRLSNPLWRLVPFLPPNAILRRQRREQGDDGTADDGREACLKPSGKQTASLPV